jgi:hypothetical protein
VNIFISHAGADRAFAEQLAAVMKASGYEVWTDRRLLPGDNWAQLIDRALREAEVMVALVSPAAVESEWVKREWEYALGSEKFAGRLIPVTIGSARSRSAAPWVFETIESVKGGPPQETAEQVMRLIESRGKGPSRVSSRVSD